MPTGLISDKYQGTAEIWESSPHIHLDSKYWFDLAEPGEELWLAIKGAKAHKASADNISNLPTTFTSKDALPEGEFGVALDLWHVKRAHFAYDASLIHGLGGQRAKLKEVFKSLLTEESRAEWKFQEEVGAL